MISKGSTYSAITGFNSDGNSFEVNCEGALGGCGKGVYCKRGVCTNRDQGQVFDVKVSREGKHEGVFKGAEFEERGAGTGRDED